MFTCPMHPEIIRDKPGLCPECGMNLIPMKGRHDHHDHTGHSQSVDKHAGHSLKMFARKFWISLLLTIPVVLYSDLPKVLIDWQGPAFPGSEYISVILGSVVFFYGGWVFIAGAWRELKAKLPGMMTLISLAISAAYLFSLYATFSRMGETLFWELTTLITIMLLGHYLEMRAVQGAQGALKELSKLLPDTAELSIGKIIPLEELKVGDIVIVRPGGKIPADGKISEGKSDINESMITGESKPIKKEKNDEVIAGTINGDGVLRIVITKIGEDTFLAGVQRLVIEAQASKSRLQILSDRAAFYLTIIAITAGGITFTSWLVANAGVVFATERLVAVLVIACPHALGLAVPLVASISTTMAARNGFLIKQRLALESAREVDVVLFDKTGTLTKGEYGVEKIWNVNAKDANEVLQLAASVDTHSEHFIAQAIVKEAEKKQIALLNTTDFSRLPGIGVKAIAQGQEIIVGSSRLLDEKNITLNQKLSEDLENEGKKGKTIIFVLQNKNLIGALALGDIIREESRDAIQELQKQNIKVAMITGDEEAVAKWVAIELGIDEYFSKVLPEEKADKVRMLQIGGKKKIAMVGDGINDAPALTQADLGIAIGAGTNVAIESAGIILVKNDPRDIVKIIQLSRLTYTKMLQNLFWATGYNAIALPLGAGALAGYGLILEPAIGAIFMSLSTVIVAINAIILKYKKL